MNSTPSLKRGALGLGEALQAPRETPRDEPNEVKCVFFVTGTAS